MNEPRVRKIPKVLCRSQTKGLARVVSISKVCDKQQGTFDNQDISIHGNYRRELWRKEKMEKVMKFTERMRKVQEEAGMVLTRAQEEIKRQADRGRKEVKEWKVEDKVMLSTKDLVFKERLAKKLVD